MKLIETRMEIGRKYSCTVCGKVAVVLIHVILK